MQEINDVRTWVGQRAAGVARLLLAAEGEIVDVEGAIAVGDHASAGERARSAVATALSVVSLCRGGEMDLDVYSVTFDYFAGVPDDMLERAHALWSSAFDLQGGADAEEWLRSLHEFIAEIEAVLELREPLPRIRSPEGMFEGLARGRDWIEAAAELGLPLVAYL